MKLDSQLNRAHLLHWIQTCHNDNKVLEQTAELLGYYFPLQRLLAEEPSVPEKDSFQAKNITPLDLPQQRPEQPNKPQVSFYYLAYQERYASETEALKETPDLLKNTRAISDQALEHYWEKEVPLTLESMLNKASMTPFIRQKLRQEVGKQLDIKTLIKQMAKQQVLRKIPTQPRLLPAGRITVIIDLNSRILPFWKDAEEACELIKIKHGKIGLDIRVLAQDEPLNNYYVYKDWQKGLLKPKVWKKIPAQSLVFIISDLGQLATENSPIHQRWLHFVKLLNRRGIEPLVLAPIAAEKQCPKLQRLTQQILWHFARGFKPQQSRGNQQEHQEKVKRMISFLSLSPHIEPELLRALCRLLPQHQGHTGVEADVYLHPDILWSHSSVSIKADKREHYQTLLEAEEPAIQQQILQLIQQHHSSQFPMVWAEAILNADCLMNVDSTLVKQAEQLMVGFTKRYYKTQQHSGMMHFTRRHLQRVHKQQKIQKEHYAYLYGMAYAADIQNGKPIPSEYNAELVQKIAKQVQAKTSYVLKQRGESLWLQPQGQTEENQQYNVEKGQVLFQFDSVQNNLLVNQQLLNLAHDNPQDLPIVSKLVETLSIETGQERFVIKALKKPSWASSLSMVQGKPIASLWLVNQYYQLTIDQENKANKRWAVVEGGNEIGFDDCGLFADISFSSITQRFRYIEPGTFMMGSPEDEKGRYDNEVQHQVTLSKGYWLADTACTQELWQAVMKDNPANFKASIQNPVEQVSWLDIQEFLNKLNQQIPQLQAQLPTEAQWEYACRTGTQTPFNFEGNISLDKVNYRGTWDNYDSWNKEAKKETVLVKDYKQNTWGLYQMHGNVWEWCQDEWNNDLGSSPVADPVQTGINSNNRSNSVHRVLRGGSWFSSGRNCRSAYRSRYTADDRDYSIGFRFSLGHERQPSTVSRSEKTETAG